MLTTPSAALGGVGQPTPRRTELIADWIELSAYVEGVEVYRASVEDRLKDAYFVADDDDAARAAASAWRVLRRRARALSAQYPFSVESDHIIIKDDCDSRYLFLLVLSSPEYLSGFSLSRGGGFRNFFELITIDALKELLPNWNVYWMGATSTEMKAAGGVVSYLGRLLKTKVLNRKHFASAQDGGIDFLAVQDSQDARPAGPAFWGQCATGLNWTEKLEEPSFDLWRNAVNVRTTPVRAFAVPFALDAENWDYAAVRSAGWVLDRERIVRALSNPSDARLVAAITKWLDSERARLPLAA
jgi:hypothetical protein